MRVVVPPPRLSPGEIIKFNGRVSAGPLTACWEWTGGRFLSGYGAFHVGRRQCYAHRIAFQESAGRQLTPDEVVRHSCDNPPCCNPAHLLVGTQADNMLDRSMRGRHAKSKFDQADIAVIRARIARGDGDAAIASAFAVNRATIRGIRSGRVYQWVPAMAVSA